MTQSSRQTPGTESHGQNGSTEKTEAYLNWQKQLIDEHVKQLKGFSKGLLQTSQWKAQVGQTPHQVVWQEGKIRLLHYPSQVPKVSDVPLLIVFSLINRSYILDLKPGKSVVEKMVQSGFDVYLIDWGETGPSDQFYTLDDYINRKMRRMVEFIKHDAQQPKVSMLGYCMGGTMAGMYAALYPDSVQALLLMAAPFDFSNKDGLLFLWADNEHFNVDKIVDTMGNIPPMFLQSAFNLLKPLQNMVDKYVKFYENMENEAFVDDFLTMEYWLNDNIPLSGAVYRQFVKDCFQHNLLIRNKMVVGHKRVDLSQINCPILSIIAQQDHLVPPCTSQPLHQVVGSKDTEIMVFPAGHIGLSVSSRAMRNLWPKVADWLQQRCEGHKSKEKPKKTKGKSQPDDN